MKRQAERELRALLRQSGEWVGRVSPEEEQATAAWLHDVERLTQLAQSALQPELPAEVLARIRMAAGRRLYRVRLFRRVGRIAVAAAAVALVGWTGWTTWQGPRRTHQLERMDNLLGLLESAEFGQVAEDGSHLEGLAVRLMELQDALLDAEPRPPQTEPTAHPSTDSQSHSSRELPARICV